MGRAAEEAGERGVDRLGQAVIEEREGEGAR